uniref:taste receptor type 1 member 1-like n=1 Tax=Pristiophorus japonicus TaxID=55135 RepID=UPI00398EBD6E
MRFAVEQINNSSELLPNVTLGYHIFDNCVSSFNIQAALDFVLGDSRWGAKPCHGLRGCRPGVSAVFGPWGSDSAAAIASILHLFHIPQLNTMLSSMKDPHQRYLKGFSTTYRLFAALFLLAVAEILHVVGAFYSCFQFQSVQGVVWQVLRLLLEILATSCSLHFTVLYANRDNSVSSALASDKQISYGASSEELSDKARFSSFFQTIPSDNNQTEAMVLLVQRFGWNWISVIASANQYGQNGKRRVVELASERGICVAHQGIIQAPGTASEQETIEMINRINFSRVNVTIVFSGFIYAKTFFRAAVNENVTGKIWIVSESISEEAIASEILNVEKIGTFLGIAVKQGQMTGFGDFLAKAIAAQNPAMDQDHLTSARNAANSKIYSQGNCAQICTECQHFTSASLLEGLKRVNFTLHNKPIYFDENGNPPMGYKVIVWDTEMESRSMNVIGSYKPNPGQLIINETLIKWNSAVGSPNDVICRVSWPLFTVSFTACLACIFVRSFQIVCIFKMATKLPKAYDYWVKYNGRYVFVFASTSLSVIHCTVWMVQQPIVTVINYSLSQTEMILLCATHNDLSMFLSGFVYTGVLSMLCFVFAFLGKDLPKNYNEAKYISFSMVLYIASWAGCMLVILSGFGKYLPMVQALATLLSLFGILAAYFLPKCYTILFKPQCNTTAFSQSCIQDYTKNRVA